MSGLTIQEANSLLNRPVIVQKGEMIDSYAPIPANMDQLYLKLIVEDGQNYAFEPPYFQNLDDLESLMYPVIKGNAATGGTLKSDFNRHLLIQFNCLGNSGTMDAVLVIESPNS